MLLCFGWMTVKLKNRWLFIGLLTLVIIVTGLLLAFFVTKWLKIYCPLYKLTGVLCPGCGNTRATLAFLHFDFKAMLKFNLLYPVEIIYIVRIYYLCSKKFIKDGGFKYHTRPDWVDIVCLVTMLIWMVIRNILAI